MHSYKLPLSDDTKIVSILQCLDGEIISTNTTVQKHDGQKQTLNPQSHSTKLGVVIENVWTVFAHLNVFASNYTFDVVGHCKLRECTIAPHNSRTPWANPKILTVNWTWNCPEILQISLSIAGNHGRLSFLYSKILVKFQFLGPHLIPAPMR